MMYAVCMFYHNLTVMFTLLRTFFGGNPPSLPILDAAYWVVEKKLFVLAGSAMPGKRGMPLLGRQLGLLNSLPTTFNCKPPRKSRGPFWLGLLHLLSQCCTLCGRQLASCQTVESLKPTRRKVTTTSQFSSLYPRHLMRRRRLAASGRKSWKSCWLLQSWQHQQKKCL